jgi:UDP-N-acetylglucosamine 2-epimerase (non-hydrolysing)
MSREIKIFEQKQLAKKVAVIIGTRPGIVMFAPIIHNLRKAKTPHIVIHTGQHYSPNMDAQFFHDLELPDPEYKLEGVADKKTHGGQTAAMLEGIESVLMKERPLLVLVGGDANTNLAGALAARKLRMLVGHVEAGERSFDWRMPEEHNRRIIDHISDLLFATAENGKEHLLKENVQGCIYVTGNTIVDASLQHLEIARRKSDALERFGLSSGEYGLMTTHREENVDFVETLRGELEGVSKAAELLRLPVIFLAHPRTKKRLREFGLWEWAQTLPGIRIYEAVGYLDFLNLIVNARLVFTDSGGVQQEACIHHVPAVTLRENTEWIETLDNGANRLAGTDVDRIIAAAEEAYHAERKWPVPFGDGDAAKKIADICVEVLEEETE